MIFRCDGVEKVQVVIRHETEFVNSAFSVGVVGQVNVKSASFTAYSVKEAMILYVGVTVTI